jgi:RHS repeat-associated protein
VSALYSFDYADRQATLQAELPGGALLPVIDAATYYPSGPLRTLDRTNGIGESRLHDSRYHPNRITATGPGGTFLDWQYSTDPVGNPTAIADLLDPASDRSYAYQDFQYFLTLGNGPWGDLSWSYDKIGNRLFETRDGTVDAYTYTPNASGLGNTARLAQVQQGLGGIRTYAFDPAGNQIGIGEPGSQLDLTYDDASRLARMDRPSAPAESDLLYDGRSFLRRAVGQAPAPASSGVFCDGFESGDLSAWDGGGGSPSPCQTRRSTEPTYSSSGQLHSVASYPGDLGATAHTHVLYFAGQPLATLDQEVGTLTHLTVDHLGTPVLASDGTGASTWIGGFEPFGADWNGAQDSGVFLRFPGQWVVGAWSRTNSVGHTYNLNRWYQATVGKYTRVDPFGLLGGINLLTYVNSNPSATIDPLGLANWTCTGLGGQAAAVLGVSFMWGSCKSDCVGGQRFAIDFSWRRLIFGVSLKFSLPISASLFTFDDGGGSIAGPNNFRYVPRNLCSTGISGSIGIGPSFGSTQFGDPLGQPSTGVEGGFGAGLSTGCGPFKINNPRLECCGSQGPRTPSIRAPRGARPTPTIGAG